MKGLQIFENEEFGRIRVVDIDHTPWFLGTDVAAALQYSDKNKAVTTHVDEEDKKVLFYRAHDESSEALWSTANDYSDKVLINESGVYSMVLSSKLPSARKFKRWVTSIVIPSIRKTGGYVDKDELFISTYLPFADDNTKLLFRTTLTTIRKQNEIIDRQQKQIEEQQPKVEYFNALVDRNLLTNFRDTAKELGIKQKVFITYLENHDYIYRDSHGNIRPYADKNKGLFELKEFANGDFTGVQTLVTPRGRETFRLLLEDKIQKGE